MLLKSAASAKPHVEAGAAGEAAVNDLRPGVRARAAS